MIDLNSINISMNDLKIIDELQKANDPCLKGSTLDYIFRTEIYKEVREIYIRQSPSKNYEFLLKQGFAKNARELDAIIDKAYYINNNKDLGICLYCTLPKPKKEIIRLRDFIEQKVKNKTYNLFTIREYLKEPFKLKKISPRHYNYEVVKYQEYKDHWDIFIIDPYKKRSI